MKGFVKSVVGIKGYGFIKGKDKEYFFHKDDLMEKDRWDDLVERAIHDRGSESVEVEFDVVESKKGPRAANVEIL